MVKLPIYQFEKEYECIKEKVRTRKREVALYYVKQMLSGLVFAVKVVFDVHKRESDRLQRKFALLIIWNLSYNYIEKCKRK